jgi:predicted anti-sigma-YlaC factor YlaD
MNDNCARARGWLAQWADRELAAAQTGWIENHWEECEACRAERDRFQRLDARLLSFGEAMEPPREAIDRVRFLAHVDRLERHRRRPLAWVPATAALLAAAAVLLVWLPNPAPRHARTGENGFVAVPYVPPIASYERSSVVSMQIPVADLLAEGYTIAADPSNLVQADVLLGEDGRVHAVRLASNQILKGAAE